MASTCGSFGGRRRRSRRGSRKMKGGNGYGVNQGPPIAVGAASHDANMTSVPDGAPVTAPIGGRRRRSRRSRKSRASRKSRKSTRRSLRGGGSPASVGYSFTGDGARGLANHSAYNANVGVDGPVPTS